MDKYTELKREYDELQQMVCKTLPEENVREAVEAWYIAAALKVWGSNLLYSPDYAVALSALSGTTYTIEQVVTAMSCCGDLERQLKVPEFFVKLVERDKKNGSADALDVLDQLNILLVGSAMINGDFASRRKTRRAIYKMMLWQPPHGMRRYRREQKVRSRLNLPKIATSPSRSHCVSL